MALARDATSSGDRIIAESYFQHAEHYFRVMNENAESRSGQDFQGRRGRRDGQQEPRSDSSGASRETAADGAPAESTAAGKAEAITVIVPEGDEEKSRAADSAIQVLSPATDSQPVAESRDDLEGAESSAKQTQLDLQTQPGAEDGSAGNGAEPPKPKRRRGRPPKAKSDESKKEVSPADATPEA